MRELFADNLVQVGNLFAARAAAHRFTVEAPVQAEADRWAALHKAAASGEIGDPAQALRERRAKAIASIP